MRWKSQLLSRQHEPHLLPGLCSWYVYRLGLLLQIVTEILGAQPHLAHGFLLGLFVDGPYVRAGFAPGVSALQGTTDGSASEHAPGWWDEALGELAPR